MRCPRLTLVTDLTRSPHPIEALAAAAVAGGADAVQVRAPQISTAERAALIDLLIPVCRGRAMLLVNNDQNLAVTRDLGLHLPERAASPVAQNIRFLTRAVHGPDGASRRREADALIAGHIFESASKPGRPPLGVDGLRNIVAAAAVPVIAIGGITIDNVASCIEAGASGVAVIGAIHEADQPERAARDLRSLIDQALDHYVAEAH